MKKIIALSIFTSILAACSTPAPVVQKSADNYNTNTQARIRAFGQNQKPTMMTYGIDCAAGEKGSKANTGASLGEAFGSFTGTVKSHSLGIPETETTKQLGKANGILSRAYFREYIVPAGKSVNVQTSYIGLTNSYDTPTQRVIMKEGSCTSKGVSFVPQAGHDYEVVGLNSRRCGVAVFEVSASGKLTPVEVQNEVKCKR